jgi:hypothetical protein
VEQIITVIVSTLCGLITALGGLAIAYLHKKTKQLEEKNRIKDQKIEALHNGFRHEVYTRILALEKSLDKVSRDTELVKDLVVENKKHYKQLEGKK